MAVAPEDHLTRGLTGSALADASPITHVTADAPPFLIVHGANDRVVPHTQSEALAAALHTAGAPVRFELLPDMDHVFGGHDNIDTIVLMSVDHLVEQLRRR